MISDQIQAASTELLDIERACVGESAAVAAADAAAAAASLDFGFQQESLESVACTQWLDCVGLSASLCPCTGRVVCARKQRERGCENIEVQRESDCIC